MQSKTITPLTTKAIVATVGSVMAVSGLQAGGVPALEILAIGAGAAFIGIAVKRQFRQQNAPTAPRAIVPDLPPDEDVRHEILRREKALQLRLNASYRNISRFVYAAMNHAMNREGTSDPARLYEVANRVYADLDPPFTLVHDYVQTAVIQWCIEHNRIPSPLPKEWGEYAGMLSQIAQDMGETNASSDVLPDVKTPVDGVLEVASSVSSDVQTSAAVVKEAVQTSTTGSNVIQLSSNLPLLAAMSDLKTKLGGDKAKCAYSLYGDWCSDMTDDLLRVRAGREWVKAHDNSLTQAQTDALTRVFKLRALKDGLLKSNPDYTGKPPFPEYLIANHTTTANAATAGE